MYNKLAAQGGGLPYNSSNIERVKLISSQAMCRMFISELKAGGEPAALRSESIK